MAETISSTIVSDENLEDSIMGEFNKRLQSMSSDDLVGQIDEPITEQENIYENIDTVQNMTKNFIQNERENESPDRENYYEEPDLIKSTLLDLNGSNKDDLEPEYDYVKPINPVFKFHTSDAPENLEKTPEKPDEKVSTKSKLFLSTEDSSCLLFTQTVTSPMLTPSEENIDFLKGFKPPQNGDDSPINEPQSPQNDIEKTTDIDLENYTSGDFNDSEEPIYENLSPVRDFTTLSDVSHDFIQQEIENLHLENVCESLKNTEDFETFETLEVGESAENCDLGAQNGVDVQENGFAQQENEFSEPENHDLRPENDFLLQQNNFSEEKHDLPKSGHISLETSEIDQEINENPKENLPESNATEIAPQIDQIAPQIEPQMSPKIENYPEYKNTKSTNNALITKLVKNLENSEAPVEKNKENDTQKTVPDKIVQNLTSQFLKNDSETENNRKDFELNANELKTINIMKQINKFEKNDEPEDTKEISESYVETTTFESMNGEKAVKKKKSKKSRKEHEKENISVKSSFSKFDALQKKNVLHVRSSDSSKAQEKFNGAQMDGSNCKKCSKVVFQMEQIKAEKAIYHKNCFKCSECNKQLNVDTYESNEGNLYCKPHFKAIFAPKAVDEDTSEPKKPKKPECIIRENEPLELPPGVFRASDKPDLGLEELQSLNVKERFQVFQNFQSEKSETDRSISPINVKRSPSILSKLARFQSKGMDIGVPDESLHDIPIEESSSDAEEEEEEQNGDGQDQDLIRAKKAHKEKPFHFTGMSDVKNKWEHGESKEKDERREERKQEIQSIRNRLFMGKQGKMKEAYQQAVMESESCVNIKKLAEEEKIEICDTRSIKERFEKGEVKHETAKDKDEDEVFESEISKKSRSLFLELDATAKSKPPQISPVQNLPKLEIKKAREAYLSKSGSQDTVKSSEIQSSDIIEVKTADIQKRFKFFETYKEPEKDRKKFRITPPREDQIKGPTPEREIYRDPDVVRSEETIEDAVVASERHTATKMLSKFRQMEENLHRESAPQGPKPLKCFTPPPEPSRPEESSGEENSETEEDTEDEIDHSKVKDEDLIEAQKAARAKQLRAKFEKWEANEIKKEQTNGSINISEEFGDEQAQLESTKLIRAKFESMRETSSNISREPKVKVNRFV